VKALCFFVLSVSSLVSAAPIADEPVFFIRSTGQPLACGQLLFPPSAPPRLRGETEYELAMDFQRMSEELPSFSQL
jgi:hypothetical protein